MPDITCENINCVYCDTNDYQCTRKYVRIGEDYPAGCRDYTAYNGSPDYKQPYYICVKTKNGVPAKVEKQGKLIQYKGYRFYTSDRITEDEGYQLTEERTGVACGTMRVIKKQNRTAEMDELLKKYPDVVTLPTARWEPTGYITGDYILVGKPHAK